MEVIRELIITLIKVLTSWLGFGFILMFFACPMNDEDQPKSMWLLGTLLGMLFVYWVWR